ncbi:MAG: type III-A CRISPR-associated RAMP protein Csm5 [archaeon]
MMNTKNLTKTFKVTVLTPVHIGSGFRKNRGIDYFTENNRTVVVDLDEICDSIANDRNAVNDLANIDENHSIGDFIQKYQLRRQLKNLREFPIAVNSHDYLEFERNGMGVPYIPGSSLKGALRTVFLRNILDQKPEPERKMILQLIQQERNPKYAANKLLSKIFGPDPNHDLMRMVTVIDSPFKNSDLALTESRVLSQEYRVWHWKPVNREQQDRPMRVYCEALRPGTSAEIILSFDMFLMKDVRSAILLRFPNKLPENFQLLANQINQYSKSMLKNESEYFEQRNDERGELDQYLRTLSTLNRSFPNDDKTIIMRLGWGSGWNSMTGDYLRTEPSLLLQVRDWYRLGRPGMQFPKSRKIGFENGKPAFPFGWIKLEIQN